MKTKHREHPLGTPGLTRRLTGDSTRPGGTPSSLRRAGRFLAKFLRWTRLG